MKTYTYTAVFSYDKYGVTIKFPMFDAEVYEDLEVTDDEILAAKEILSLYVSDYLDEGKQLPKNNLDILVLTSDKIVDITIDEDDLNSVIRVDGKKLWEQAQQKAQQEYEEEFGEGSWEEVDKCEREDYVFDAYEELKGEL